MITHRRTEWVGLLIRHHQQSSFFVAEGKSREDRDHGYYMDFAERYADFVVEFEKMEGDLTRCALFPGTAVSPKGYGGRDKFKD